MYFQPGKVKYEKGTVLWCPARDFIAVDHFLDFLGQF